MRLMISPSHPAAGHHCSIPPFYFQVYPNTYIDIHKNQQVSRGLGCRWRPIQAAQVRHHPSSCPMQLPPQEHFHPHPSRGREATALN